MSNIPLLAEIGVRHPLCVAAGTILENPYAARCLVEETGEAGSYRWRPIGLIEARATPHSVKPGPWNTGSRISANALSGMTPKLHPDGSISHSIVTPEAAKRLTRRTSLRQALTRCVCRIEGARAPGMKQRP